MSTIGSMSSMSGGSIAMRQIGQRPPHNQRPDASAMAEKLFSKLDTTGQGYIEQAGFTSALENVTSSSDATALFAALDADSDGKLTEQEFSSSLKALSEQLDQQFMSMRLQGGMPPGGMPPPPPPSGGGEDEGFSKDELQSQLSEISGSNNSRDTQRASLISAVVENFDAADTDGNGKVSFAEAMALEQSLSSAASTAVTSTATSTANATSNESSNELRWMQQIVQLMRAYGLEQNSGGSTLNSLA